MTESIEMRTTSMPLDQWALVIAGVLVIAVPWWLGLLWICGALR